MKFMLKYFIAGLAGLVSVVVFWLFINLTSWIFFTIILLIWLAILISAHLYIYQKSARKWSELSLLIITVVSMVGLIILVEELWLRWLIIILAGLTFAFLFSHEPLPQGELTHQQKPFRRVLIIIWIFDLFCLFSLGFALNIFFQSWPFSVLTLFIGLVIFYVNLNVWGNYFSFPWRDLFWWSAILSLAIMELVWVLHFLTFGYFTLGFISIWSWYLMMLLIRYNLTSEGIIWKKQRFFLLVNFILMALFLFFIARWI